MSDDKERARLEKKASEKGIPAAAQAAFDALCKAKEASGSVEKTETEITELKKQINGSDEDEKNKKLQQLQETLETQNNTKKEMQTCQRTAIKTLAQKVNTFLDNVIGDCRENSDHFPYVERALNTLIERCRFRQMREEADDDNYLSALKKDFNTAEVRIRDALNHVTTVVEMIENAAKNQSDLLESFHTALKEVANSEADVKNAALYLTRPGVLQRLRHLEEVIGSSNMRDAVIDALEPSRWRALEVSSSAFKRFEGPLVVLGVLGLLVAQPTYWMSVTPWWEPFQWLPCLWALLTAIAVASTLKFRDNDYDERIRRALVRTFTGPKDRRGWIRALISVFQKEDAKIPREFWEKEKFEKPNEKKPDEKIDPAVYFKGAVKPSKKRIEFGKSICLAFIIASILSLYLIQEFIRGSWNMTSIPLGQKYYEQPFRPLEREIISLVIGNDALSGECAIACGHVFWSGREQMHVRPEPEKCMMADDSQPSDPASNNDGSLIVIPRSEIRRLAYWKTGTPAIEPVPRSCRRLEANGALTVNLNAALDSVDGTPINIELNNDAPPQILNFSIPGDRAARFFPTYVIDGQLQRLERPHIPLLLFDSPQSDKDSKQPWWTVVGKPAGAKPEAKDAKQFPARKIEKNKEKAGYLSEVGEFLASCATGSNPVMLDVMGFASEEKFEYNYALAEGRRRAVVQVLKEKAINTNLKLRVMGNDLPITEIDLEKLPSRFNNETEMKEERERWIKSANSTDNRLFARAVIIEILDNKFGNCSPTLEAN